jgi:DNA-binding CsgD family transcriptional regulator
MQPSRGIPSRRFERFSGAGREPVALVLLNPVATGISIPPAPIQAVFGLSPAEARMASALTAGRTLAEYANEAGLSRNTVRNQLSAVLAKTGTRRQTELVASMVATLGPGRGR